MLVGARLYELVCYRYAVYEAGARYAYVEGRDRSCPYLLLDQTGGRREEHVGRYGGYDYEVQVLGLKFRVCKRPLSRFGGHVARRLVGARDPALAYPGPLHYPLVGGIHHLLELLICKDPLGKV